MTFLPARVAAVLACSAVVVASAPVPPATPLAGQQPAAAAQQQPPTFRAGVKVVRVDVSVTGKGDRPVEDLRAADFDVAEDGAPQRVDTVQFLRLTGHPAAGDDNSLEIRSQEHAEAEAARDDVRVFVLFLDDYHIDRSPAVTIPLRRDLSAFVARLQPTDLVAIVDPLTPLSAMQFTRSKPDLLDVIRKFDGRQGQMFPVRSAVEEAQLQSGDVWRLRAQVTLSAMTALVTKLGGLKEGRKTVLFISQGPSITFSSGTVEDDLRDVTAAANRANVTIHVLDPRGLAGAGRGSTDTLYRLALETGGRTIINTNSYDAGLREVVDDASAYYLLGYTPTRSEDDGKYHKISVKVKRRGLRVLAREGYFAPSPKEVAAAEAAAHKPEVPGVTAAIRTLARLEPRGGAAQAWVGFSRNGDGKTRVTVTWDPAVPPPPRPVGQLDVETVPAGSRTPSGPARTMPSPAAGTHVRPSQSFVLAPGDVLLRFTAHGGDGEIVDRWELPITVPDFGAAPVSLATPRFYRVASVAEMKELQAAASPVPTASRTLRQTDRVLVDAECYSVRAGAAPSVEAFLLSADGRPLLALPLTALGEGKARLELPLRGLGKGLYLLAVRARIPGAPQAEEVVAFRVIP